MTTTTLNKNVVTVVASSSNAAGATTRGTVDLRTALGGTLTMKITNGAIGPSAQCQCNILIAHNEGSTPAAASAGVDWKTLWSFGGGTTSNATTEQSFDIPQGAMHFEIEFTGNTGQAVTVEAILSKITSATTA